MATHDDINCVTVSGTLQELPYIFATKSGFRVVRLRLACQEVRRSRDANGQPTQRVSTTYISAKVIGQENIDAAMVLNKGDRIVCAGKLHIDYSQDEAGNARREPVVETHRAVLLHDGDEA